MAKENGTDLFRIELDGGTNHLFVEASDWQKAIEIAERVAPKIFTGSITMIRVVGTYSKIKGVWV